MKQVIVASPDGKVKFTLDSNPVQLAYSVVLDDTIVIESSPLDMKVNECDLSSEVIFNDLDRHIVYIDDIGYGKPAAAQ
jgi:hypothetical protein